VGRGTRTHVDESLLVVIYNDHSHPSFVIRPPSSVLSHPVVLRRRCAAALVNDKSRARVVVVVVSREGTEQMASLDDLYAVARRLCFDVAQGVAQLENEDDGRRSATKDARARELRARANELTRVTNELERQWRAQAMTQSMGKSDTWKVRKNARDDDDDDDDDEDEDEDERQKRAKTRRGRG